MERNKALEVLNSMPFCNGCKWETPFSCDECEEAISMAKELLKEHEQIKSPDEFKSILLGMFDSIWDVEIDHPVFQDTVGELMEGVLQAYRYAVKWDD